MTARIYETNMIIDDSDSEMRVSLDMIGVNHLDCSMSSVLNPGRSIPFSGIVSFKGLN